MFKTRSCGCKGLRSCKICETECGAWQIAENISLRKDDAYIYCPLCNKLWPGWELDVFKLHPDHHGEPLGFEGIKVIPDFISQEEETELLKCIDEVPWDLSQSGRYKQNYGPKCNFKKRKVVAKNFKGYPMFTRYIQDRFESVDLLRSFKTVEQCSLDYKTQRGSSIDPHIDDCWIWGERIPTLSLLTDSVLTLNYFKGPQTRYNLVDSFSYPRVVASTDSVKSHSELQREYEVLQGEFETRDGETEQAETQNEKIVQTETRDREPVQVETRASDVLESDKTHIGDVNVKVNNVTSNGEALQAETRASDALELHKKHIGDANVKVNNVTSTVDCVKTPNEKILVRIPMPRRSLLILYGKARYDYEHSILREDINDRRVCITYRELTPTFLAFGNDAKAGKEILERAKLFWEHEANGVVDQSVMLS